jgi:light-regulated signal transduction histidine kinase (bacteriophytochrome)
LLKRKNEELDQYAHIVSHDLKAPLRGIDNVITWIEEDHTRELSPKVKEYIQLIKGRLARGENLIQGLLSYARVGREMPVKEETDLNELLEEIKENSVFAVLEMVLELQRGLPQIFTERLPLQQVLSNLVSNAIKYHDKSDGRISVSFREYTDYYEFSVADNGPGIAKHYHDKIFVIFQTLQERDSFESTGVGLAIVKKILDDRKQTIDIISETGKGSTFTFTWPK